LHPAGWELGENSATAARLNGASSLSKQPSLFPSETQPPKNVIKKP